MSTNNEIVIEGLSAGEVAYPLLVSLYADTKIGKTFFGANFPNAVIIDFPPNKLSFGKPVIDEVALHRSVGEGFRSLFMPIRKPDNTLVWKPKIDNFDYKNQYHFPKSWEEFQTAIEKAKFYAEDVATIPNSGKIWVVLDDSYRWRAMEIIHYIQVNKKRWPSQQEFGLITQSMASQITAIQNFANVLIIHRTTKDFDTGQKVPLIYPASADFNSDVIIELIHRDKEGGVNIQDGKDKRLVALIHSTGHDFACNNVNYQFEVLDPDPETVLAAAKIPRVFW